MRLTNFNYCEHHVSKYLIYIYIILYQNNVCYWYVQIQQIQWSDRSTLVNLKFSWVYVHVKKMSSKWSKACPTSYSTKTLISTILRSSLSSFNSQAHTAANMAKGLSAVAACWKRPGHQKANDPIDPICRSLLSWFGACFSPVWLFQWIGCFTPGSVRSPAATVWSLHPWINPSTLPLVDFASHLSQVFVKAHWTGGLKVFAHSTFTSLDNILASRQVAHLKPSDHQVIPFARTNGLLGSKQVHF